MLAQKQWTTLCLATLLLLARSVLSSDEVVVAGVTIATVSHASLKIHHDNYEAVKYGPYKSGTDVWEGVEFDVQQITISPHEIEDFVDYSRSFSRFTRRMTAQQKDQFAEALGFAEFAKQSAKLTRSITIRENERTVAVMLLITKKKTAMANLISSCLPCMRMPLRELGWCGANSGMPISTTNVCWRDGRLTASCRNCKIVTNYDRHEDRETLKQLAILLRGMDDLWSLVQNAFSEDIYGQDT